MNNIKALFFIISTFYYLIIQFFISTAKMQSDCSTLTKNFNVPNLKIKALIYLKSLHKL